MKRGPSPNRVESESSHGEPSAEQGLCSCCKEASTCTFPREPGRPVWECEEFNGILPPPLGRTSLSRSVSSIPPRGVLDEPIPPSLDPLPGRGLCTNCENRATCTFPKPEGGVWHCEEYR